MSKPRVKAKLLCVDDNYRKYQLFFSFLEEEGFEIQFAGNGREGVERAREWLPDLILMDLRMPIMDGFQAAECLRALPQTQQIPIVAFSGDVEERVRLKTQAAGMNAFMPKSISLSELLSTLRAYLPAGTE